MAEQTSDIPTLKRRVSQAKIHDQLKVFLIGSRRTGTVTLTSLLEEIGYGKKYHGWTLWWYRKRDIAFWEKVLEKQGNVEWDELFITHGPFHVTSDEPSILFWKHLVEYYPSMKIILTIRDANKWYKSYYNAICKTISQPVLLFVARRLQYFIPYATRYFAVFRYGLIKTFGPNVIETLKFDKYFAIEGFNKRNKEIKEYFQNSNQMDRFMIINWDRKDKNKMFLELMDFLEIEMTDKQLKQRA
eukprot:140930_1